MIIGMSVPKNRTLTPAPRPKKNPILIAVSFLIKIESVFKYFIT